MLSILVPSFRPHMLNTMYQSILTSWSRPFELIIVSHLELPIELKGIQNIKWIYDQGTPTRKRQIALINATGKYTTWFVDDGIYLPEKLDEVYDTIGFGSVISFKYGDCPPGKKCNPVMRSDAYYDFSYFPPLLTMPNIPKRCKILSFGVMPTHLLKTMGGWDAQFEHLPMAEADLSIRLKKLGYNVTVAPQLILELPHVIGIEGDHAPVHYAQKENDEPLFRKMYRDDSCKDRTIIDINNWEKADKIWKRRL